MPASKSREYRGETIDLGRYKVCVRAGRVVVWTDTDREPWLEKKGDTIYVVAREDLGKLDSDSPSGLN